MTALSVHSPASVPVLLDDLLLDAQVELESADLASLGEAVGRARVELVRHCIQYSAPPIEVAGDSPDQVAPLPNVDEDLPRAEKVARLFHERYEELAPSFGYQTRPESAKPWADIPPQYRQHMIATTVAVLHDLTEALAPPPRN
jgi:hypothetical protein